MNEPYVSSVKGTAVVYFMNQQRLRKTRIKLPNNKRHNLLPLKRSLWSF